MNEKCTIKQVLRLGEKTYKIVLKDNFLAESLISKKIEKIFNEKINNLH